MKTIITFIAIITLFLTFPAYALSPQPPRKIPLDENKIMSLGLHHVFATVLQFPGEVTHVSGEGLTNGQRDASVQYQIGADKNIMILKPVKENFSMIMTVMLGKRAFLFHLTSSEEPVILVHFTESKGQPKALDLERELELFELEELVRLPSYERQLELMRLVAEEDYLRPLMPSLYTAYESRQSKEEHTSKPYLITLERIGKFRDEDSLVFYGTITNTDSIDEVSFYWRCEALELKIAGTQGFPINECIFQGGFPGPGESTSYTALLVGDGNGGPGHFSLDNDFTLLFGEKKQ